MLHLRVRAGTQTAVHSISKLTRFTPVVSGLLGEAVDHGRVPCE